MTLAHLSRQRWRIAIALSAIMVVIYFGFILLIAFDAPLVAHLIVPGVSVGIVLGALVIVAAWIVTLVYVRWANEHMDVRVQALRSGQGAP